MLFMWLICAHHGLFDKPQVPHVLAHKCFKAVANITFEEII